jgi:hypothetical protein
MFVPQGGEVLHRLANTMEIVDPDVAYPWTLRAHVDED